MSEVPHENVLVKYLKKYWILIAVSIIFATLHNYCNLLLPKFIQELVDDIIIQGNFDMDTLSNFIERLVIIFVLSGIFDLVRTWITQWVSTNLIYNIRNDMFMALQRQSYSYYDQNRTGDIMSKTTHDVGAIQVFLTNSFQNFFKNIITFIIIFTFVWQSNWQMALLFLALTPPLYILMIWYRKRIRPSSYAMYKAKGGMVSTIQENVTGIRVVKAYGRQENEMEKYLKDNVEFINKSKEVIRLSTIYGPLSEYFTMIGSALLVFSRGIFSCSEFNEFRGSCPELRLFFDGL
jgi:ATP-binding cassette subfamily B protein